MTFDGIGCAIVATYVYGVENVDVVYCNYDDINEKVTSFLFGNDYLKYDRIFITDISITREVAEQIQISLKQEEIINIILLDHHKSALFLNEFDWCTVQVENEQGLCCGTSLFFDYLVNIDAIDCFSVTGNHVCLFSEIVRKYDTWLWKELGDEIPKQYNDLFSIMGKSNFLTEMVKRLNSDDIFQFTELDKNLLHYRQQEIDIYVYQKKRNLIIKQIDGYKVGIVFNERFSSEIGDSICSSTPEIDYLIMINVNFSCSLRTVKDIDLSVIAKKIGNGGGHSKSAGFSVTKEQKNQIINLILGENND